MYNWAKPRIAIPVHGERRHLIEHAKFARTLQVPMALAPKNGDLIRISADGAEVVDEVPHGRLHVDGNFITDADADSMRERRKLAFAGHLMVSLAITQDGAIQSGPDVRAVGIADSRDYPLDVFVDELADAAEAAFGKLSRKDRRDEESVEEAIRRAVRREASRIWGKKPSVDVIALTV